MQTMELRNFYLVGILSLVLSYPLSSATVCLSSNKLIIKNKHGKGSFNKSGDLKRAYKLSRQTIAPPHITNSLHTSFNGKDIIVVDNSSILDQIEKESFNVNISSDKKKQTIWGFGAAVTGACLDNIETLSKEDQQNTLMKLFSPINGAGLSLLRLPIGSNDFTSEDFSLDDTPGNTPDPKLKKMNMKRLDRLLDFVKKAKKINPNIQVIISTWSPPAWMKNTKKLRGGEINQSSYPSYANYLTKVIKHIQNNNIKVKAMTVLNEPYIENAKTDWSFPQSYMSIKDQKNFVTNYLKPSLKANNIKIAILAHDHNWDNAGDSLAAIDDKNSRYAQDIGGIAYHCYGGNFETLKQSLKSHPNLIAINTECSGTLSSYDKSGDLQWWLESQSVDAIKEGLSGSLGWNLCLDPKGGPHNGGCENCRGLLTIDKNSANNKIIENPEYFALAQTSRFVTTGAHVIEATNSNRSGIVSVAFENPDRSIILVIRNPTDKVFSASIKFDNYQVGTKLIPAKGATSLLITRSLRK